MVCISRKVGTRPADSREMVGNLMKVLEHLTPDEQKPGQIH